MSKVTPGHPGEEQLLRYADGELSPRESADVRAHLEACWDCRAELDQLQAAVSDCVHYRKSVLQAHLPPPPAPWRDLSAGFAAVNRELAAAGEPASWWRALWDAVSAPRFWAPALAAALAVVFVVLPWLRETPGVQAAELLRKAVAAAEAAPAAAVKAPRKLAVRTRTRKASVPYAASAVELQPVAKMFAESRYDWNDPLSAKSYVAWREQLTAKTDEVTVDDTGGFYRVSTRAEAGELAEATLRLRQSDLHPVEGTFRFRNGEWVEVSEVESARVEPVTISSNAPPKSLPRADASAAAAAGSPKEPEAATAAPAATVADELRVLAALHNIGADLGDPIEIVRAGADIHVKGVGLDARRQTQIAQALAGIAPVRLQFTATGSTVGSGDPAATQILPRSAPMAVRAGASPLQAKLEAQLGSPAAVEQFANDVFDRNESVMERAHAIRRLAARFPSPGVLPAGERAALNVLLADHARQLVRQAGQLRTALKPVLGGGSFQPLPGGGTGPGSADGVFQAARRLEVSLASLLGSAASGDPASLPQRVAADVATLEEVTRRYLESMGQ